MLEAFNVLAAATSLNAREIEAELRKKWPDGPSERTLRDWLKEARPDDSGTWEIGNPPHEGNRWILESLAAVTEETNGRRSFLTNAEAHWIVVLRGAAPDIPAWDAYLFAGLYVRRDAAGRSHRDLDLLLALKPWEPESTARIAKARRNGALEHQGMPLWDLPFESWRLAVESLGIEVLLESKAEENVTEG